ncbi:hypothetical protein V1512DRAFT_264209 [Lipomyces arxii]|uniref:uncharacterized protein n=1 Tax=Lipomyces arxii TaxID=56418 RepID=UPI0034CD1E03
MQGRFSAWLKSKDHDDRSSPRRQNEPLSPSPLSKVNKRTRHEPSAQPKNAKPIDKNANGDATTPTHAITSVKLSPKKNTKSRKRTNSLTNSMLRYITSSPSPQKPVRLNSQNESFSPLKNLPSSPFKLASASPSPSPIKSSPFKSSAAIKLSPRKLFVSSPGKVSAQQTQLRTPSTTRSVLTSPTEDVETPGSFHSAVSRLDSRTQQDDNELVSSQGTVLDSPLPTSTTEYVKQDHEQNDDEMEDVSTAVAAASNNATEKIRVDTVITVIDESESSVDTVSDPIVNEQVVVDPGLSQSFHDEVLESANEQPVISDSIIAEQKQAITESLIEELRTCEQALETLVTTGTVTNDDATTKPDSIDETVTEPVVAAEAFNTEPEFCKSVPECTNLVIDDKAITESGVIDGIVTVPVTAAHTLKTCESVPTVTEPNIEKSVINGDTITKSGIIDEDITDSVTAAEAPVSEPETCNPILSAIARSQTTERVVAKAAIYDDTVAEPGIIDELITEPSAVAKPATTELLHTEPIHAQPAVSELIPVVSRHMLTRPLPMPKPVRFEVRIPPVPLQTLQNALATTATPAEKTPNAQTTTAAAINDDDDTDSEVSDIEAPKTNSPDKPEAAPIPSTTTKPVISNEELLNSILGVKSRVTTRSSTRASTIVTPTPNPSYKLPSSLKLLGTQAKASRRLSEMMEIAVAYSHHKTDAAKDLLTGKITKTDYVAAVGDAGNESILNLIDGANETTKKQNVFYFFGSSIRGLDSLYIGDSDFPKLPKGWWAPCLENSVTRYNAFTSGFVKDMIEIGNELPDSVMRYLTLEVVRERNDHLANSYAEVLSMCNGFAIDESLIEQVYSCFGVQDLVHSKQDLVPPVDNDGARYNLVNIKLTLEVLTQRISQQRFDTGLFRSLILFCIYIFLDVDVGKLLYDTSSELYSVLISRVPTEQWSDEAGYIIETVCSRITDPTEQVRLLERLPIVPGMLATQLRTNLALAFFLNDVRSVLTLATDRVPLSAKIIPELKTNLLYKLKSPSGQSTRQTTPTPRLTADSDMSDESENEFDVVEFDYGLLRTRIRCLDYALMSTVRLDKDLNDIKIVIELLRQLNRRIFNPHGKFPVRTDAKSAIQACEYRLLYMIVGGNGVRQSVLERHFNTNMA